MFNISPFSLSMRQAGARRRIVWKRWIRMSDKRRYAPAWETTPSVYRPATISAAEIAAKTPYVIGEPSAIPAQLISISAPKPIKPICARLPMILASVETASVPLTGAAICKSRRVICGIEYLKRRAIEYPLLPVLFKTRLFFHQAAVQPALVHQFPVASAFRDPAV